MQLFYGPRCKALTAFLGAAAVIGLMFFGWLRPFAQTAADVRENTLRLHVVANSDSVFDQSLKLKVRDEILSNTGELFLAQSNKADALSAAQKALPLIREAAEKAVAAQGASQAVTVEVVEMAFPTTAYETFTLPAGRYDALRVTLGEGAGHNWFCVLYPALCLPAAQGQKGYPSAKEQKLIEKGYEIRFALLDWLENARKKS